MRKLILEGGAAVNGRRILQSEVPSIIDKVDGILSGLGSSRDNRFCGNEVSYNQG